MNGFDDIGTSRARFFAFRLLPGDDVVLSLRNVVSSAGMRAGYIAGAVGSLSTVCLRLAGEPDGTQVDGCFEVVSLIGTVDAEGEHIHAAISDPSGRVVGGHVMEGCIVRTTLELVLGELEDLEFVREYCSVSTYQELAVHPRRK